MNNRYVISLCVLAAVLSVVMSAQTGPTLVAVNMPKYPALARQAGVDGIVKLSFTLLPNAGEPTDVEVISGHTLLKEAALENLKTWKFENNNGTERRYEAIFSYHLEGTEFPHPTSACVTFRSLQVDIVTDRLEPK